MKDILNYYKYLYKTDLHEAYINFKVCSKDTIPSDCKSLDLKYFEPEFGKLTSLRNPFYFVICLFFEVLLDQGIHYSNRLKHNSFFKNKCPKLHLGFTSNISPCRLLKIAEIYSNSTLTSVLDTINIASFHFVKYYEQTFYKFVMLDEEKKKFFSAIINELERFLRVPHNHLSMPRGAAWEDNKMIVMMGKSILAHIYQRDGIN